MIRYITIFLLITISYSSAQVRFGKVSKEELRQAKSTIDAEAPAEILSKVGEYEVYYNSAIESFEVKKNIEVRIKIYDKEKAPSDIMNLNIPIYKTGSVKEKISSIQAITYNLVDGKIEKTKVKRSDIYTEDVSEFLDVEKLAFPNIKDGSIIEYKYAIRSPRFFDLDTWYIQAQFPVKYNRFVVRYPEYFIFQKDKRGALMNKINTSQRPLNNNIKLNIDELVYENVPPLKREPFVQNLNNLKTSIRYELREFNNPGYGYKNFSSTWARIVEDLYKSDSYGGDLNGSNRFLDEDVAQFANIADTHEKLNAIFNFVQDNYAWNGYLNLYPMEGVRKTFKEKAGNGTDLNFILIAMLRKVNIDANPIVLSTVENGMLNLFPSKQKLNHSITGVIINDRLYVMDPSYQFSKVDMLPKQDLNFTGYLIEGKGQYKKVDLVNRLVSEIKSVLNYELKDDILEGSFTKTKTNYFAMSDLSDKASDESNFEADFLSGLDADVTDFNFRVNKTNDAIRYQLKFEDDKNIEEIGNKLLLKPLLFEATESNAFNFSTIERKYPLEFGTPFTTTYTVEFTIPEDYEVESLPEAKKILLSQNAGGYSIKFQQVDNKIVVKSLLHIGYSLLPPSFYQEIKDMFQKIIEIENEQIILHKK